MRRYSLKPIRHGGKTMAMINPPTFMQNRSDHTAQSDRLSDSMALAPNNVGFTWRSGVRGYGDFQVSAQVTPNMTVSVARGAASVAGTENAQQGAYGCFNDGGVDMTIAPAHPTLARNDLVCVQVRDSQYSGTFNDNILVVVTGVASSTPADPAVPNNTMVLARIRVTAGVIAVTSGMIDDLRPFLTVLREPIPVRSVAERNLLNTWPGLQAKRLDTGSVEEYTGTAWTTVRYGTAVSPRVKAHKASNLSIPNATPTTIPLGTLDIDTTGSIWTPPGDTYTINRDGLWTIGVGVQWQGSTGGSKVSLININGVPIVVSSPASPGASVANYPNNSFCMCTEYLHAGDIVTVVVWQNSGAAIDVQPVGGGGNAGTFITLAWLLP
jgi:hypothetical protein